MGKELTLKEFAKMGGDATKKKYGKEYFKKLIKKRWDRVKANDVKVKGKE